jgi:hypothetical protein
MHDGNYVIASSLKRPWRKQINLLLGYLYFYNPVWLVALLLRKPNKVSHKSAAMQIIGMMGLAQTIRRTSGWVFRLMWGRIVRLHQAPASRIPMRAVDGSSASHDSCETPSFPLPSRGVRLPVAS